MLERQRRKALVTHPYSPGSKSPPLRKTLKKRRRIWIAVTIAAATPRANRKPLLMLITAQLRLSRTKLRPGTTPATRIGKCADPPAAMSQVGTWLTRLETGETGTPMKHNSSRELFAYWDKCRHGRRAPERGDIEPGEIRKVLGDIFILALDPTAGHSFRLAGTRVCALFAREIKGEAFADLWTEADVLSLRNIVAAIANEGCGIVASISGTNDEGTELALELLMLPLARLGRTDARLIGSLVPLTVPYWLGVRPLVELRLGTLRHVGPAVGTAEAPSLIPGAGSQRFRKGLVVHDGGLAD